MPPPDEAACLFSKDGLEDVEGFEMSLDWTAFFLGEGDALEAKSKKIIKKLILEC